jgi:hypothetical protein
MWPGDQQAGGQSGGQQYPSGANPPQQPQGPYGQPPNPYAQPGYPPQQPYPQHPAQPPAQPPGPPPVQQPPYQQPVQPYGTASPYAQPGHQQPGPGGYPTPQVFGPPMSGGADGGRPGGRSKATIAVAIGAALAVIAAVVVTVVFVTGSGDKKADAHGSTSPAVTATTPASPTSTPTTDPATQEPPADEGEDDPRGPAGSNDVAPVIAGWHVVKREERNSAFDVPPDWTVGSESMSIGYADDAGKPQVVVGAPAYYMEKACTNGKDTVANATAGTKGAAGASSMQAAAENEARAWAKWAFQENGKGTVSPAQNSKAFHNAYGITGWQAQATMTSVPKANKCSSNGIAYAVAWLDPAQKTPTPVVWVLWARQGVSDQLAQSVVDRIKSTIRPIKK